MIQPKRLEVEDDGTIDEIVFEGYVHLEKMDSGSYSLVIGDSYFWLNARSRNHLIVTATEVDRKDFTC